MSFFYLLLGHMIGDFILQTNTIAEKKLVDKKWTALHAGIVTLCMLMLSFPFGIWVVGAVFLNGVLHFYIDLCKPWLAKRYPMSALTYFLLDQMAHVLLIVFISLLADEVPEFLPMDYELIKFLLVLSFITSFSAVFNQFVLNAAFPRNNKKFFEKGEKPIGNATRIFITASLYLSYRYSPFFLVFIALAMLLFIYQSNIHWNSWMTLEQLGAKIAMDVAVSFAGMILLLIG